MSYCLRDSPLVLDSLTESGRGGVRMNSGGGESKVEWSGAGKEASGTERQRGGHNTSQI